MVTMLKVLVVNDQKTPMAFVVSVLEEIFGHSKDEAQMIALHADLNGDAICGIYRQHAEAQYLVRSATARSRLHGFPLDFLIRPFPFWERAAVWLFGMVMKVVPEYRVSPARELPPS
jgi:ATP-dependent Clp protease adaptor protein ClpS